MPYTQSHYPFENKKKHNLRLPYQLTSLLKGFIKQEDGKCITGVRSSHVLEYIPYSVLSKHILQCYIVPKAVKVSSTIIML